MRFATGAFCDWLSIKQRYPAGGLPVINGGCVVVIDNDRPTPASAGGFDYLVIDEANVKFTTEKKIQHCGSFDSSIRIRCDGSQVEVDGNVGRFGRPDNVFGYSVLDCIKRASQIIAPLGLPAFHDTGVIYLSGPDKYRLAPDTSILTRVDLTKNYQTGSASTASRLIHYFGGHHQGRFVPKLYIGQNNLPSGLTWGEGSKYYSAKLYAKYASLGDNASQRVRDYALETGLVRHEIGLKSRYLTQENLNTIYSWQKFADRKEGEDMSNVIYDKFTKILDQSRNSVNIDPFNDLPAKLVGMAVAWRNGFDFWNNPEYSRATKFRYRAALKKYGIDISIPCDVSKLSTRVQVISMQPAGVPTWYEGESNLREREAA